jgi:hypothetical protein
MAPKRGLFKSACRRFFFKNGYARVVLLNYQETPRFPPSTADRQLAGEQSCLNGCRRTLYRCIAANQTAEPVLNHPIKLKRLFGVLGKCNDAEYFSSYYITIFERCLATAAILKCSHSLSPPTAADSLSPNRR